MIGGAGTSIWAGTIDDNDPNARIRGSWLDDESGTWGTGRKMMLDPYVGQAVDGVTDAIYAADHDFEPSDDSPLAREVAEFCRFAFFDCLNWTRVLQDVLHYFRDGVSLLETTDDVRPVPRDRFPNHKGRGRGILYTGFHHRPAGTIDQWHQSKRDPSKLRSVRQFIQGSDGERAGFRTLPGRRLLRYTWMQEGANYLGTAPLRRAYGAWYRKINLVAIAMIAHERHHVGVPTVVLDELANIPEDEIEKIKTSLLEMRAHQKAYLILDKVKSFDFKSAAGGTDIEGAIQEANTEITHAFGGRWMLLGGQGGNGSYALAGTQQGRTHVVTDRHVDFIDSGLNRGADGWSPVERIVRLNYGDKAPIPRKVTRNVPTVDYTKIAELLPKLNTVGFRLTEQDENQIRGWLLMSKRSPKDKLLEPVTPAAPEIQEGPEEMNQDV